MLRSSYFAMILILLPAKQSSSYGKDTTCSNSLCNNEAFCDLINGKPICQCIGSTYFKGPNCQEQVDNCASNPCQNGVPCTNALGQPLCGPCPDGYGGHFCHIKVGESIVTKVYLHHNRLGYVASNQNFLLMAESLGKVSFQLELYADNYAIAAFSTNPATTNRWRRSSNLGAEVRRLRLEHPEKIPYSSGFYFVTPASFWESGTQKLRLKVTDERSEESYMDQAFEMEIVQRPGKCRPTVELVHCSDPFDPQILDVTQFNTISVIVRNRCWADTKLRFTWRVLDIDESVLLHSYGETSTPRLKIKPYPSWASRSAEIAQSFLMRIGISEIYEDEDDDDDEIVSHTVKRCYIFVLSKPVVARIIGGPEREVSSDTAIRLDGSESRDLAVPPDDESSLLFKWSCASRSDPGNQYCTDLRSSEKVLVVPRGRLKVGNSYAFTLNVQSEISRQSRDRVTQSIIPVPRQPLYVDIECVRNCAQRKFVPQQLLHLKAVCWNCEWEAEREYSWTVNGKEMSSTNRLIIEKPDEEATFRAEVQLVSGDGRGKSRIELRMNTAPTGGKCQVRPASGTEYQTEFEISCADFADVDLPLTHEFTMQDFTLDRTSDSSTRVYLPQGNVITIRICDSLRACTIERVTVDVAEDRTASHIGLAEFLEKGDRSLRRLISDGAVEQAMILAAAAARLISSDSDSDYLGEQLDDFDILDLMDIDQYLYVIRQMLKQMQQFKSDGAQALHAVLKNLNRGLRKILNDGDARQMSLREYRDRQKDIATLLHALENQKEKFMPVQTLGPPRVHTYDRLAEPYEEIDVDDIYVLQRINAWLLFSSVMDKCIGLLGQVATLVHEPEEPKILTQLSPLQFETFCSERRRPTLGTAASEEVAEIELGREVEGELKTLLNSNSILLQMVTTPKNPYWWFPDRHGIQTGVVYLSGFAPNSGNTEIALRNSFQITFKVKNASAVTGTSNSSAYMHGRLLGSDDMNIFQIIVPSNALLIITFVSTTMDLRVSLKRKKKPTGFMTHKSKIIINKDNSSRPLLLMNRRDETVKVFLGVVPLAEIRKDNALAFFDFLPVLRQCLSWDPAASDEPEWISSKCLPEETDSIENGFRCQCQHMSAFAGAVFPTVGFSLFNVGNLLSKLPFNWIMFCSQMALALLFIFWVFLIYLKLDPNRESLVILPKLSPNLGKNTTDGVVFVRFVTGGDLIATTTAGIFLIIYTVRGPVQYKIYQNPMRPQLTNHSTCTARLPLNPSLLIRPLSLHIKHDGGGRYPTWYLQRLEISYEGLRKPIRLRTEMWLTETGVDLNEIMEDMPRRRHKWREFIEHLETKFANWFLLNPLFGPWKYGNSTCNRFERTLIWIVKLALTILIVSIHFGWTTLHNYEEERDEYRYLHIHSPEILYLSLICFGVGCAIQIVIKLIFLKCNYEAPRTPV